MTLVLAFEESMFMVALEAGNFHLHIFAEAATKEERGVQRGFITPRPHSSAAHKCSRLQILPMDDNFASEEERFCYLCHISQLSCFAKDSADGGMTRMSVYDGGPLAM